MQESEFRIRERTAEILAANNPTIREAVPVLIKALKDSDPRVRLRTVIALGDIDPTASENRPGSSGCRSICI